MLSFRVPTHCAVAYLPALDHSRHNHGACIRGHRFQKPLLLHDVSLRQRSASRRGFWLATALLLVVAPPRSPHPPRGVSTLHSVERWPAMISPVRECQEKRHFVCGRGDKPFPGYLAQGRESEKRREKKLARLRKRSPCVAFYLTGTPKNFFKSNQAKFAFRTRNSIKSHPLNFPESEQLTARYLGKEKRDPRNVKHVLITWVAPASSRSRKGST